VVLQGKDELEAAGLALHRVDLGKRSHDPPARLRIHRQEVDDVGPILTFWSEAAVLEDEPPGIHTDDDRHRRI
jgi:hypothetical protein